MAETTLNEITLNENQIDCLMMIASSFIVELYPERAVTLLQFLLCFEKDNQDAIHQLVYAGFMSEQYELALTTLKRLDPANTEPSLDLLAAKVLVALERPEEARQYQKRYQQAAANPVETDPVGASPA